MRTAFCEWAQEAESGRNMILFAREIKNKEDETKKIQ